MDREDDENSIICIKTVLSTLRNDISILNIARSSMTEEYLPSQLKKYEASDYNYDIDVNYFLRKIYEEDKQVLGLFLECLYKRIGNCFDCRRRGSDKCDSEYYENLDVGPTCRSHTEQGIKNKLTKCIEDLGYSINEEGIVTSRDKEEFISTSVNRNDQKKVVTFCPSVFKLPEGSIVKNCVSVMMPFSADFNDVYSKIKNACSKNEMTARRSDDFWKDSVVIQDIFELIYRSSIVIVDFSKKNENVFYEAGIAHTLGKNVIPITQSIDNIPFDLRHHRHIEYLNNGEGLNKLETKLVARLASLKK